MGKIGITLLSILAIIVLGAILAFLIVLNIYKDEIWERVVFKDGKRSARQAKIPNKKEKKPRRGV